MPAASNDDGREEELELVYEAGPDRVGGEGGTADADVLLGRRLHPGNRIGVEVPLDPGPGAGFDLQRRGVPDVAK